MSSFHLAKGKWGLRVALLLLTLVAGGTYGWHWWQTGRFIESTDDAYVGANITPISAKVPGYITEVAVTDNQAVKKGALLVALDDRDYRLALAKAEGAVAAQQAQQANLEARRHQQQAVIEQAHDQIAASQAELSRAHDDQQRYHRLLGQSLVSKQHAKQADTDYQQAQAETKKAEAALAVAERQLLVLQTEAQQTAAQLQQAEAVLDKARLDLSYTRILAPFDGVVGNRRARTGAYAQTAAQLLVLVPSHGLWIDANLKESQLARLHQGNSATIVADVLPGRTFHGQVLSLSPATGAQFSVLPPENATGNFTKVVQRVPVRIALDGKDAELGLLRPGLSVTASIDVR